MAAESYPEDLRYHREHQWARVDSAAGEATFGITWFAQDSLGEIVFLSPPRVGYRTVKDEAYGDIESVKAVSDLYAPLSGEVIEVNAAVAGEAATVINSDPYGEGWIVRVRLADPTEAGDLLDADGYRGLIAPA